MINEMKKNEQNSIEQILFSDDECKTVFIDCTFNTEAMENK